MTGEPDLQLGESGEWVTHLQQRLQALALYQGSIDGHYGEQTETAVRQLAEYGGIEHSGTVSAVTWQALEHQEQQAGLGATAGQEYGQEYGGQQYGAEQYGAEQHVAHEAAHVAQQYGGQQYGAAEHEAQHSGSGQEQAELPVGHVTEDGQWRWDGHGWQAAAQEHGAEQGAEHGTAQAEHAAQAAEQGAEQGAADKYAIAVNDDADDAATDEAELLV